MEEDEAKTVIAGEVEHAFLPKHQQAIEIFIGHRFDCRLAAISQLALGEMQRHLCGQRKQLLLDCDTAQLVTAERDEFTGQAFGQTL